MKLDQVDTESRVLHVARLKTGLSTTQPADIECCLTDGRKVGVQLTTWLDQQQMNDAKRHEASRYHWRKHSNLFRRTTRSTFF